MKRVFLIFIMSALLFFVLNTYRVYEGGDGGEGGGIVLGVEDGVGLLFGDGYAATYEAPVFFDFSHFADIGDG